MLKKPTATTPRVRVDSTVLAFRIGSVCRAMAEGWADIGYTVCNSHKHSSRRRPTAPGPEPLPIGKSPRRPKASKPSVASAKFLAFL